VAPFKPLFPMASGTGRGGGRCPVMTAAKPPKSPAEPVFEIDKRVRKALLPYRETLPVEAVGWLSQAGDQMQLRLIGGGTVALGLLRRDSRMIGAGIRMLIAHETATLMKDFVKHRVIRARPRSAAGKRQRPRKGRDTRKESSSFPSGHSAGAVAVARAAAAVYPAHGRSANAAAAAVSLGRIPGCAHYPTDVAAGAAIGALAAGLVNAGWRRAARWLVKAKA
jgi:membrane-associated phospholipid phosphatase